MRHLIFILLICQSFYLHAQSADHTAARNRITAALKKLKGDGKLRSYSFKQVNQSFAHLARPWMTDTTKMSGGFSLAVADNELFVADSFVSRTNTYRAFTYYNQKDHQLRDTGTRGNDISHDERLHYLYNTAIYTPVLVLNDFLSLPQSNFQRYVKGKADTVFYKNDTRIIGIAIDPLKNEVTAITVLYPHEMYGDVLRTITYSGYLPNGTSLYPSRVKESELGVVKNDMKISASAKPANLALLRNNIPQAEYEQEKVYGVNYMKFNENIHYIELKEADMRSIVVEFKDFLLVGGAPLNNTNGIYIIDKLAELFPSKPIRYFVAGHHHPHYLGGVRPFIAKNVRVLAHSSNAKYIKQLATFPHTLEPDNLQQHPVTLQLDTFENEKTISDGNLEMRIIHIGKMSGHTDDYLVYYIPKYNLLIEDDLVFLPNDGSVKPASKRERGLYDAMRMYNLDVNMIIQSWPVNSYGVKTLFFAGDLAESVMKADAQKKQ